MIRSNRQQVYKGQHVEARMEPFPHWEGNWHIRLVFRNSTQDVEMVFPEVHWKEFKNDLIAHIRNLKVTIGHVTSPGIESVPGSEGNGPVELSTDNYTVDFPIADWPAAQYELLECFDVVSKWLKRNRT